MKERSSVSREAVTQPRTVANTVKLCIRLLDTLNDPLRDLVRYQGQLGGFVGEAVESVDLTRVPLVVIRDTKAKDTTVRVTEAVFKRLSKMSKLREASVNVLVNTAIAHWLKSRERKRVRFQGDR